MITGTTRSTPMKTPESPKNLKPGRTLWLVRRGVDSTPRARHLLPPLHPWPPNMPTSTRHHSQLTGKSLEPPSTSGSSLSLPWPVHPSPEKKPHGRLMTASSLPSTQKPRTRSLTPWDTTSGELRQGHGRSDYGTCSSVTKYCATRKSKSG